ncbi:hypothetical protein OSB04_026585 [Centaurea solstitialis]|uniref:3-oxo-5-alpha-steroid 4-dehydrogenase C-terminal domain-containing protein n=1 Tax=Centaurea solstitialis TaxID=347529 RepID=A0AA38W7D6_9ASTR|nr:hypothetical protein OSB04_026585 [Centaurea solstitialis]
MVISLLLFPPPSSIYVTTMSILSCASLANGGYMEIKGKHMQYSKFFDAVTASKDREIKLPSRIGMLIAYTPAFLAGLLAYVVLPYRDQRILTLVSVLIVHFFKRVVEVLFVHKYSGSMALDAAIPIGLSYLISTMTMIYAQYLSQEFREPAIDLKHVGIALFVIGIVGSFYHHNILSNLRKKGDREYRIPKGGLFDLVICPHYLFEIIEFIGVSCIAQTLYALFFTLGTMFYLMGRSYATREWYRSKFGEKFHKDVKALFPYTF